MSNAECRVDSVGEIQRSTFGTGVDLWKRGKSIAVSGKSSGRQVDVRTQHDNGARPRFHTVSSVKRAKLWGSNVKCKVQRAEAYRLKCECHM